MADMHIDGIVYASRESAGHQSTKYRRASVGTGWNETAGKTTTFTRGPLRNQRVSISRKIRRYIRETNPYAIVDMEDIRYTIRQGRYSDKQTTKRSFPIPALM